MKKTESGLGTFLVNGFGDRYLYAVNRNAFNTIGSDALYTSMYGEKLFAEYQLNIIIGTDSGIFPNYIAKRGVPTGSRYLFVELPDVLDAILRDGLLANLPPEICVTNMNSWADQAEKYQLSEYVFLDSLNIHESLASTDANLPEYRDISWTLNLEIKNTVHRLLTSINCRQFIVRQMECLTENRICFAETMVGAFNGKTAIILAGGPSLREALPWVKENIDRILIIAVSRISRILRDEGIVPHIIASVDPQKISFEVSREMLEFGTALEQPLFIHSNHASPLLLGQWQGKSVYTGPLFPWNTSLNTDNLTYSGPTVSNFALSVAMHMGFETILLSGVDLCFSKEGQTHAAGSNENKVGPDLSQLSPRIETYGGEYSDTNQGYAQSLDILKIQARYARTHGHRIYNCSRAAAKVPLIEFKALSEIELPDAANVQEILSLRCLAPTATDRLAHYRKIKIELERARRKLQQILNLSREALECNDGLFGRNGKKKDFKHKIRMDKIEQRLDRNYSEFTQLIKSFGLRKFLSILKNPKREEDWTDEQIETATHEYYEAYVEGTGQIIDIIDGTLQRIDCRMEEENRTPDFARLFSQWRTDGQPGRACMWKNRNPEKLNYMSPEESAEFQDLESEFRRIMTEEQTSQIKLLEKLHDVKNTRCKALLLFKRADIIALETMAQGLDNHPDQEKAVPYLHFVKGLVAELRNEPAQAFAHYQNLFDESSHALVEDSLLQTASISMAHNDVDNAVLSLECLVGISSVYLSPYGDLLKAVGRYDEAFDAYNRYLAHAPNDVGILLKLALLCKEAGLNDPAKELLQRILDEDPANGAAGIMLNEIAEVA